MKGRKKSALNDIKEVKDFGIFRQNMQKQDHTNPECTRIEWM